MRASVPGINGLPPTPPPRRNRTYSASISAAVMSPTANSPRCGRRYRSSTDRVRRIVVGAHRSRRSRTTLRAVRSSVTAHQPSASIGRWPPSPPILARHPHATRGMWWSDRSGDVPGSVPTNTRSSHDLALTHRPVHRSMLVNGGRSVGIGVGAVGSTNARTPEQTVPHQGFVERMTRFELRPSPWQIIKGDGTGPPTRCTSPSSLSPASSSVHSAEALSSDLRLTRYTSTNPEDGSAVLRTPKRSAFARQRRTFGMNVLRHRWMAAPWSMPKR
jgi:hypothetical protein